MSAPAPNAAAARPTIVLIEVITRTLRAGSSIACEPPDSRALVVMRVGCDTNGWLAVMGSRR
jgi:hypothetical protein